MGTPPRVTIPTLPSDTLDLGTEEHSESPDTGSWGSAHALEMLLLHNDRAVASQVHGLSRRHVVGGTGSTEGKEQLLEILSPYAEGDGEVDLVAAARLL